MNTQTISIEYKDLTAGVICSEHNCPMALAIKRVHNLANVWVYRTTTIITPTNPEGPQEKIVLRHNQDLTNWIDYYDKREGRGHDYYPPPINVKLDFEETEVTIVKVNRYPQHTFKDKDPLIFSFEKRGDSRIET